MFVYPFILSLIFNTCMSQYEPVKVVFENTLTLPKSTFCIALDFEELDFVFLDNGTHAEVMWENLKKLNNKTEFLNTKWDRNLLGMVYAFVGSITEIENTRGNVFASAKTFFDNRYPEAMKILEQYLIENDISFSELEQKLGQEIKELLDLVAERYEMSGYSFRISVKIPFGPVTYVSSDEICYELDFGPIGPVVDKREIHTLSADEAKLAERILTQRTISLSFNGEKRISRGDISNVANGVICTTFGTFLTATFSIDGLYKLNDSCTDDQDKCASICRLEMVKELCNCTALTFEKYYDELLPDLCSRSKYMECLNYTGFQDNECIRKCNSPLCENRKYNIVYKERPQYYETSRAHISFSVGFFQFPVYEQNFR